MFAHMTESASRAIGTPLIAVLCGGSALILGAAVIGAAVAGAGSNRLAGSLCGFVAGILAVVASGPMVVGSEIAVFCVPVLGLCVAFGVGYSVAAKSRQEPPENPGRAPESTQS